MGKPVRCRFGWHRYVKVHAPESIDPVPYYLRCELCGHERDMPAPPPVDAAGG
jgi:hypothetical protein